MKSKILILVSLLSGLTIPQVIIQTDINLSENLIIWQDSLKTPVYGHMSVIINPINIARNTNIFFIDNGTPNALTTVHLCTPTSLWFISAGNLYYNSTVL